jgi:hypothetical protein
MRLEMSLLVLMAAAVVEAQTELPTELENCVGEQADFCFDGEPALIDSCGAIFEGYQGRIAWPALRNVGPVTIAVQTRSTSLRGQTLFPLYVEVTARTGPGAGTDCRTVLGGLVVLVAHSADQCGGTWESVGPLDLTAYGVPMGAPYSVSCAFFRSTPADITARTVGFSCIRIHTSASLVAAAQWSAVKVLYQ